MGKTYIGIADKNIKNLAFDVNQDYPSNFYGWSRVNKGTYFSNSTSTYVIDGFPSASTTKDTSGTGTSATPQTCLAFRQMFDKTAISYEEQIIYVSIKVKSSSSNPNGYPFVKIAYSTYQNLYENAAYSIDIYSIDNLTEMNLNDDNWHQFSGRYSNKDSNNDIRIFKHINCGIQTTSRRQAGNIITIKDAVVVNLTEMFGSGNEPTKEWCDEHIVVLDNIVPDGDMESSSWSGGNYSTTEKLFGSRSQYFPANSTTVQTIATPIMPVVGHKYYGRHYLKTDGNVTAADCRFEWYAGDGPGLNYVFGWNQGNYPNWTMESSIVTVDAVNGSSYVCRSFDVSNTGAVWADGLMIVDLTEAFGSGNEPTKQWCDEHIPFFTTTKCLFNTDVTVPSRARKVKAIYTGVNNVARKITNGYIGINSTARTFFGNGRREWLWDKYEYEYVSQLDSEDNSGQPGAFYAGTTYSINHDTGLFEVACTTQITNNSSGATNAVGKYFVGNGGTPPTSSGTYSGQYLYLITESHKPTLGKLKITYSRYRSNFTLGDYTSVFNTNLNQYPKKGIQNGYYYILQNDIVQLGISYDGSYIDEIVNMEDGWYRLLTLTGSGKLDIESSVCADIWICGGGITPYGGTYNYGGSGAYCDSLENTNFQNLLLWIGSAGSVSVIKNDLFLIAPGGSFAPYGIQTETGGTGFNPSQSSNTMRVYRTGYNTGGTGGGQRGSTYTDDSRFKFYYGVGLGDGKLNKLPFNDSYFPYPYCDGGGGGYSAYGPDKGGNGGTNGGNGNYQIDATGLTYRGGLGGGHYGGNGAYNSSVAGSNATGYGSGGGGGYYDRDYDDEKDKWVTSSTGQGSGYQGVCFIRIPLFREYEVYQLPTTYTRLQYVESNGNQYIDTGIVPNAFTNVLCKFQLTEVTSSNVVIFGSSSFVFRKYSDTIFRTNTADFTTITPDTLIHSVTKGGLSATLCTPNYPNSTYETLGQSEQTIDYSISIFANHTGNNTYQQPSSIKLYSFKIYDASNLVRDMIPAKNSSNVAGLYDLVNDVFYTSISGTALIAGPIVS